VGSTDGPKLFELTAELLACACPVCDDIIAEVLDVTLDIQFILLEPTDVELLSRGSALELSANVFFVVTDDSADAHVRSLSEKKGNKLKANIRLTL
jgi:hypothetical protein